MENYLPGSPDKYCSHSNFITVISLSAVRNGTTRNRPAVLPICLVTQLYRPIGIMRTPGNHQALLDTR
jgi:hypothetical protein